MRGARAQKQMDQLVRSIEQIARCGNDSQQDGQDILDGVSPEGRARLLTSAACSLITSQSALLDFRAARSLLESRIRDTSLEIIISSSSSDQSSQVVVLFSLLYLFLVLQQASPIKDEEWAEAQRDLLDELFMLNWDGGTQLLLCFALADLAELIARDNLMKFKVGSTWYPHEAWSAIQIVEYHSK